MPGTKVVLYRAEDGSCPFLTWFEKLPAKAQDKCFARLERLRDLGHDLRRPEADLLRDGIHELRCTWLGVHYRVLYFFFGNVAAVVSHGIAKERAVSAREIERAIARKEQFERDPSRYTYEEM